MGEGDRDSKGLGVAGAYEGEGEDGGRGGDGNVLGRGGVPEVEPQRLIVFYGEVGGDGVAL